MIYHHPIFLSGSINSYPKQHSEHLLINFIQVFQNHHVIKYVIVYHSTLTSLPEKQTSNPSYGVYFIIYTIYRVRNIKAIPDLFSFLISVFQLITKYYRFCVLSNWGTESIFLICNVKCHSCSLNVVLQWTIILSFWFLFYARPYFLVYYLFIYFLLLYISKMYSMIFQYIYT